MKSIEEHDDSQKKYYDVPVDDLILSMENYFEFNGFKFVSLRRLKEFKKKRYADCHDEKDKNDIVLIDSVLSHNENSLNTYIVKVRVRLRRRKRIIVYYYHETRNSILKTLHVYDSLKRMRDWYKLKMM